MIRFEKYMYMDVNGTIYWQVDNINIFYFMYLTFGYYHYSGFQDDWGTINLGVTDLKL